MDEHRVKIVNELTLSIQNEDHTLMNPLKYVISSNFKSSDVEFCGYTIPHPADNLSNLVVQFKEDQSIEKVIDEVSNGLDTLEEISSKILSSFEEEAKKKNLS